MGIHTGYPFFYAFLAILNYYDYICDMENVDSFKKSGTLSEEYVVVNGIEYKCWVHAKPINPRWWKTRIRDAWQILRGRAIAIQYFNDLTEEQKENYVKKYWLKLS